MTTFVAFWLGLVQGLTEFFPVSSSGHLVLFQHYFGIQEPQLAFDVMVHLGTAAAVIAYTWPELKGIFSSLGRLPRWLANGELKAAWAQNQSLRLLAWLIVGSIPAGAVGVLFEDQLSAVFGNPAAVSCLLVVTGIILLATDRTQGKKELGQMDAKGSFAVGLAQAVAVLPGISRSGSTIAAGLKAGLSREAAAKYSFLLSLPAMLVGFVTAAFSGYFAIRFLVQLLQRGKLRWFAYYCFAVGLISLVIL
jgi:undecaprenyl-diphosphatase